MSEKFEHLVRNVLGARHALREAFLQEFPVGTQITWLWRESHIQTGVVEYNNGQGRDYANPEMRVKNDRTGKLVWVELSMQPQRSVYNEEE